MVLNIGDGVVDFLTSLKPGTPTLDEYKSGVRIAKADWFMISETASTESS